MIGRTILNHIPPVFGCDTFAQVVGQSQKSFKKNMEHLMKSVDICDSILHRQVSKKETLPTESQINFIQHLDVLLEEIIRKI
jgi:hypothetical protein